MGKLNRIVSFYTVSKAGPFSGLLKKKQRAKIETHFLRDQHTSLKSHFKSIADDYCTIVILYEVFILISKS